jgi:ribonuclease T2
MWHRLLWAAPVASLAGSATIHQAATAQSWQCKAPVSLPRPTLETPQPREIRRTPVAGYTLALSWSREFCRARAKDAGAQLQCAGKIGEFGFILHGLWPEGKGPDYPQWCRGAPLLSRKIIAENICVTPSVQLLQHEWAKHGTCMARKPETYFGAAKLLYEAIEFPDMDKLSRQGEKNGMPLYAAALAEAFAIHNQGLPPSAVQVKTNGRGWLKEVHICLNKAFRPQACPGFTRGAPANAQVKIWRGG